MRSKFQNRPIDITHVNCQCDSEDAYVEGAYFLDGDQRELTDDECHAATSECAAEVGEMWEDYQRDRAEAAADAAADRAMDR